MIVTDRKCNCQKIAQVEDIPLIYISYQLIKKKYPNDYHKIYEEKLLEKLKAFKIDYIILAGYMRLIKSSILEAYRGKIINVHPADLTYSVNQKRVYIGSNAIKQALKDKRKQTRSSIIFIDEEVDNGPIFVSGPWVSYLGKYPIDDDSVAKHQERQKFTSDHPALIRAIDLLLSKEVVLIDGRVYVDGNRLSLSGYEM